MITPQVAHVHEARADFEELRHRRDLMLVGAHGFAGSSCLLRSPEGERVLLMRLKGEMPPAAAESLVRHLSVGEAQWEGMTGTHLILHADGVADGFLEALDEASPEWKITLHVPQLDVDLEEAVAGVPLGEQLGPVPVMLSVSEEDFSRLVTNVAQVKSEFMGRITALGEEEVLRSDWGMLYFFDGSWASARMALAFLDGHGIEYQAMQDPSDGQYGVLTNFVSAHAAREIARLDLRELLEAGRSKSLDEELWTLLHEQGDEDEGEDEGVQGQ